MSRLEGEVGPGWPGLVYQTRVLEPGPRWQGTTEWGGLSTNRESAEGLSLVKGAVGHSMVGHGGSGSVLNRVLDRVSVVGGRMGGLVVSVMFCMVGSMVVPMVTISIS